MPDCQRKFTSINLFRVRVTLALGAILTVYVNPGDPAAELTSRDLPPVRGAEEVIATRLGHEHLRIVSRIPLPDGLTPQQIGGRAVEAAGEFIKYVQDAGWESKKENRQRRGGEFYFRKLVVLDLKAVIGPASHPSGGRMKPCVEVAVDYTRRLPYADLLGKDPADAPRFPGSVRVRWMNLLGDFAAKYLVVGSSNDVEAFFRKELQKLGWEEAKGVGTLNYRKGGVKTAQDMPAVRVDKPLENIEVMIPTTLSVSIADKEGLVEIGLGRSTGSADLGTNRQDLETAVTPTKDVKPQDRRVVTTIDEKEDIPLYPGLVVVSRESLALNTRGEDTLRLSCEIPKAPMKEALALAAFYKDSLSGRGWTLQKEEWHGIGRVLEYRKDAVGVTLRVKAVGRYPIPERAPDIRIPVEIDLTTDIPRREVSGDDISRVPRFPGSVRFFVLKAGIDHIVKYKAVANREEAEWFFVEKLQEQGWSFAGNDTTGLLFIPSDTAESATGALAKGKLVPTTLKVKIDDPAGPTVVIGMDLTKGD